MLLAINEILIEYGQQIEVLANSRRYPPVVHSLTCYKGIKNIFVLTMITEIGKPTKPSLETLAPGYRLW
jgi:hypothetical protein